LKASIAIDKDRQSGKLSIVVKGNPLVATIGLAALVLLITVLANSAVRFVQSYGAYEGTVVSIERDWMSILLRDEGFVHKKVTIRAHDDTILKRFISEYVVSFHRIEIGDVIHKETGFFKKAYGKNKKSLYQMKKDVEEIQKKMGQY
jgi:hypothetical protein